MRCQVDKDSLPGKSYFARTVLVIDGGERVAGVLNIDEHN